MITKFVAVEGALVALIVAASNTLDGTAEKIVLWAAAGAGIVWFWANVARPVGKVLRRLAQAVDAIEHLPTMYDRIDQVEKRLDNAERRGKQVESGMNAVIRELGIEDQVRKMQSEDFGA